MSDYRNFGNIEKMGVFKLIVLHETIVSVTGTSSKMASKLCQKLLTITFQEAPVRTIQVCSNFTSMWPK